MRSLRVYPLLARAPSLAAASVLLILATTIAGASDLRRTPIVKAVASARYAVVNIHGHKTVGSVDAGRADPLREVNGMGTGVVIDRRGYILTNYHVIDGVSQIQVTNADGKTSVSQLIARDRATDLAVIKIPPDEKLHVIEIGTSSDLMVGEPVIAVGNAYGYNHSVTRGIVSALHRDVPVSETQQYFDLIQTDASINPGNSGGPLLNIDGEMIGLNVAVRVGAQGIGFAIPVDQALEIAAQMIANYNQKTRWHGVVGETKYQAASPALFVTSLEPGSPAENAGVAVGDIITAVGQTPIHRKLDFELALLERPVGTELSIKALRNQQSQTVDLVVAEKPDQSVYETVTQVWDVTGLRLAPVSAEELQRRSKQYRGGLRITAVRPGSPAERQNVMPGDILVGMHVWETITMENLGYVITQSDVDRTRPVKCYILRNDRTHYTYLPVEATIRR